MGRIAFDFAGQTALITGATGGIGAELARTFHAAGANLVLLDLAPEPLEALAAELGDPERVRLFPGDAGDPELIAAALEAAAEDFGGLDFVIPVAGIYPESSVLDTSDELWRRVQSINLEAVFRLLREALPLIRPGGAIVNFASVAGHRGSKHHAHYAASKAGIIALTRSLALEAGPDVRVNAVSPGTIETPMTRALVAERGETMLHDTPLARFGQPGEVAAAAAFLCSDAASFINGETLHVNGGLFMAG